MEVTINYGLPFNVLIEAENLQSLGNVHFDKAMHQSYLHTVYSMPHIIVALPHFA